MRGKTYIAVFSKAVQDHMDKKYIGSVLLGNFLKQRHTLKVLELDRGYTS